MNYYSDEPPPGQDPQPHGQGRQPHGTGASEPMFNVPSAVLGLAAAIIGAHVVAVFFFAQNYGVLLSWFAFMPARYDATLAALYNFGGAPLTDYTSFITYAFMHGDFTHLGMNVIWLLAMGSAVAQRIGGLRFLLFFFAATIGGAALHLLVHPGAVVPVIGASAGVSGLMAAAMRILFAPRGFVRREDGRLQIVSGTLPSLVDRRVLMIAGVWVVINLIMGLFGMVSMGGQVIAIAWEAHIGGFLVGLLAFRLFDRGLQYR